MEIFDKVVTIFSQLSDVEKIRPEHTLQSDLGLDSLQMVTLLMMLEETFQIFLDEADMNPFDLANVFDVVQLLEKYVGGESDEKSENEN